MTSVTRKAASSPHLSHRTSDTVAVARNGKRTGGRFMAVFYGRQDPRKFLMRAYWTVVANATRKAVAGHCSPRGRGNATAHRKDRVAGRLMTMFPSVSQHASHMQPTCNPIDSL